MGSSRYAEIVARNVVRRLEELGLTRQELSQRSRVSISFLSELTAGRANPSLRVLDALAEGLETSVPLLLIDLEPLPPGFERLSAVTLPKDRVADVKRWAAGAERELKKLRS